MQVVLAGHVVSAFYGPPCSGAYDVTAAVRRLQEERGGGRAGAALRLEVRGVSRVMIRRLPASKVSPPSPSILKGGTWQAALGDPFPGQKTLLRVVVAH